MYVPKISPDLIHRLYLVGQKKNLPMTRLVSEAVEKYLNEVEKEEQSVEHAG